MIGVGRKGNLPEKDDESIEALEQQFEISTGKIRKILGGVKDKNQLGRDEKNALRIEYSHAAQIARKISERCVDDEKSEKYKKYYKQLSDKAESYGSVLKRQIPPTKLEDVKGLEDVKKLVRTFLFMVKNPDILKYYKMDGGLGMLMYGAPGTGKTMIAEAIANELNMPLFTITPADIFKSYVGESEAAVKQLFQEMEACDDGVILFVDECESIFCKRTADMKDYKAAVTNELLQRLNGFGVDGSKRILIGATNRPDMIDPAYLRYKRFSHLVHVTPPDATAKRAIIESKLKGVELDGVGVDDILAMTIRSTVRETDFGAQEVFAYYSSADICGIIEEACRIAMETLIEKQSKTPIPVTMEMFEKAFIKIPPSISADLLEEYAKFRERINEA